MDSGEKTSPLEERKMTAAVLSWNLYACVCVCVTCRFVRNLSTSKEGVIAAANLVSLIGKSKSCQSLTSSGIET